MILDKKIEIGISSSNIKFFKTKYKCKVGDKIKIEVEDLNKKSNFRVNCKCDVCGKETNIKYQAYNLNIEKYGIYSCSRKCAQFKIEKTNLEKYGESCVLKSEEIKDKIKKTNLEKYGVENPFQSKIIQDKIKYTNIEKFNFEHPLQNKDILNKRLKTNLEKYGFEHPLQNKDILNKLINTNLERYKSKYTVTCPYFKKKIQETTMKNWGTKHPFQSEEIKEKIKNTNLERYGVENPSQNEEIHMKAQINAFKLKKYKDTNLYYRASYEKHFLDTFYNQIKIQNGLSFNYNYLNKNRKYFSDFYLPDQNLIIEIKSKYTYELELQQNIAKQNSVLNSKYNFLFIIDKDYSKLLDLI